MEVISSAVRSFSLAHPVLSPVKERKLIPPSVLGSIIKDNHEITHERHIYGPAYFENMGSLIDLIGGGGVDARYENIVKVLTSSVSSIIQPFLEIPLFSMLWSKPLGLFRTTPITSQYDLVISSLAQSSLGENSPVYMLVFRTWICFLLDTYIHVESKNLFYFWMRNTEVLAFLYFTLCLRLISV
jgi:hypothetical protein